MTVSKMLTNHNSRRYLIKSRNEGSATEDCYFYITRSHTLQCRRTPFTGALIVSEEVVARPHWCVQNFRSEYSISRYRIIPLHEQVSINSIYL